MKEMITINPATEKELKRYPLMTQLEVDKIIQEMSEVQKSWSQTLPSERTPFLEKTAHLLRKNQNDCKNNTKRLEVTITFIKLCRNRLGF